MFNLGIARPCQIIVNVMFKHIYTAGVYMYQVSVMNIYF